MDKSNKVKMSLPKAFTLVEVLVTALITSAVIAGIYAAFVVGNRTWAHYNDSVVFRQEARRTISRVVSELRESKNILVVKDDETGETRISFYRPYVGIIEYRWSAEGQNAERILRIQNGKKKIVANHISSLVFVYKKNSVLIDITVTTDPLWGKPMTFEIKEQVALRSKTELKNNKKWSL